MTFIVSSHVFKCIATAQLFFVGIQTAMCAPPDGFRQGAGGKVVLVWAGNPNIFHKGHEEVWRGGRRVG